MSDQILRMDLEIRELMKADRYEDLARRTKAICEKLEKEEVLFLLSMLSNPLLSPGTRLNMLIYVESPI